MIFVYIPVKLYPWLDLKSREGIICTHAEFIKYHRQHWQEKEQAAKDWQAEHDRFMREEAAKAREEAALTLQRERESEAKLEAYRERKALLDLDKEIAEMQQKPVNRDEIQQQPRPKNDFEP